MILKLLIIGLIIFFSFRLVDLILEKTNFSKKILHHLEYIIPSLELLVWMAFVSWVVLSAFQNQRYYILFFLALSFILLIVPAFILVRDLVFGIFLKVSNKIGEGTIIETDGVKGTIVKTALFYIDLEDDQGSLKSIGYYRLKSKEISILGENHELEKIDIEFRLPIKGSVNEMLDQLNYQLLCSPWVAASILPIIEKIEESKESLYVKVGIYTIHKKYEDAIKAMVNKQWNLI